MQDVRLVKGIGFRSRLNGSVATVGKRSGGWAEVEVEGRRLKWRSGHWEVLQVGSSPVRCSLFGAMSSATLRSIFAHLSTRELVLVCSSSKTTAAALCGVYVDINHWLMGTDAPLGHSSTRFLSFLAWIVRHRLRPRSFRAHLWPADLLALDALAVHCGADALTSLDLRVGYTKQACSGSALVPDPNCEPGPVIDLTSSRSMSIEDREAQWQEEAARTLRRVLRHCPTRTPTVTSVLSCFTCLESLQIQLRSDIMDAAGLLEALRPLRCLQTLRLRLSSPFPHRSTLPNSLRLTLPSLPCLRELYLAGDMEGPVLYVVSPTLRRLDCTGANSGKAVNTIPLYLECPVLEEVRLARPRFGGLTTIWCSFASGDEPQDALSRDTSTHACYVVGESCRGLYSQADGAKHYGDPRPPPSDSGPASLWRIPDGVRVTVLPGY